MTIDAYKLAARAFLDGGAGYIAALGGRDLSAIGELGYGYRDP
jgi:hypothetical protein